MSSSDYREPTNDELWVQPPPAAQPPAAGHGLAPLPQPPAPAHLPRQLPMAQQRPDRTVFSLAIVSMALGVPLTAISTSMVGLPGLLVVWVAIVAVNFIYARSRRPEA